MLAKRGERITRRTALTEKQSLPNAARRLRAIPGVVKRQRTGLPPNVCWDSNRDNRWLVQFYRGGRRWRFRTPTLEQATTISMRAYYLDNEIITAAEAIKAEHEQYPTNNDNNNDT